MNIILEQVFCLSLVLSTSVGILEIYAHALTNLNIEKESFQVITQNLIEKNKKRNSYSYRTISLVKKNFCQKYKCKIGKIEYSNQRIITNQTTYIEPSALYEKK